MKTFKLSILIMLVSIGLNAFSQNKNLPDVDIYTLDGSSLNAKDIPTTGLVLVIFFWSSDNRESLDQIRLLNEEYETGLKEKNVRIVAICTNFSGTMEKIRPLVKGMDLDFEVYTDKNNELKRAMSIPCVPYTLVIQPVEGIYRHLGYCSNLGELINRQSYQGIAKASGTK